MATSFQSCSGLVEELIAPIADLDRAIASFRMRSLADRNWYELLYRKLRPQLGSSAFLIVAVVGGTNIGKSVIFNHIAGAKLSSSSPMASGTKHPSALIPQRMAGQIPLAEIFPGFEICPFENAEQPLEDSQEHRLFYRIVDHTPENLIILDTPDVDSVSQVNWERAAHVRQSADVLIAVLTQQKYNDAAVKQFFRQAAHEDKVVIVVFNQCLLPEDEEYWPIWLETFCQETGVLPHAVYLAPNDRRAAEETRLPFFERPWPSDTPLSSSPDEPRDLLKDLSQLRFGEIKIQSLSGALKQLVDLEEGIPSWLKDVRTRGGEFREAFDLLASKRLVEIERWPPLPNSVLITQIREWWAEQREGWSASVHGFYNALGRAVAYPVRLLQERSQPERLTPIEEYRKREWETVLEILDRTIERLTWLRDLGNPLLTPRLQPLLEGTSRTELIQKLKTQHDQINFERDVRGLVDVHLQKFREEQPNSYQLFRRLDTAAAAVRPAISAVLFMSGAGPVGDALMPVFADTAIQGVVHLAGDAVGGTVVTTVGDKVLTDTASAGAGYLEAKFRQLHTAFVQRRVAWMAQQLEANLFGDLPNQLAEFSRITEHSAYAKIQSLVNQLRKEIAFIEEASHG